LTSVRPHAQAKVAELVQMLPQMNLNVYTLKQQEKALAALLKQVREALFRTAEEQAVRACVRVLVWAASDGATKELASANDRVLQDATRTAVTKLRKALAAAVVCMAPEKTGSCETRQYHNKK
jgi:small-conductance mechanosensitive channel